MSNTRLLKSGSGSDLNLTKSSSGTLNKKKSNQGSLDSVGSSGSTTNEQLNKDKRNQGSLVDSTGSYNNGYNNKAKRNRDSLDSAGSGSSPSIINPKERRNKLEEYISKDFDQFENFENEIETPPETSEEKVADQNEHQSRNHDDAKSESKLKTCMTKYKISVFFAIFLFIQLLEIILLALESYALYKDHRWNLIVEGNSSFPTLDDSQNFFRNKTLNVNGEEGEILRNLLKRNSAMSPTCIALVVLTYLASLVHFLLVYVFRITLESSKYTNVIYVLLGVINLISASLLAVMLGEEYEEQYRDAATILFESNRSEVAVGKAEKLRELRIEEEIFGSILTLCAFVSKIRTGFLWATPSKLEEKDRPTVEIGANYSVSIYSVRRDKREEYSLADLDKLGFCNYSYIRTAEYCLGFLISFVCFLIPVLNCLRGVCCEDCLEPEEIVPLPRKKNQTVLMILEQGDNSTWNREGEESPLGKMSKDYPPDEAVGEPSFGKIGLPVTGKNSLPDLALRESHFTKSKR